MCIRDRYTTYKATELTLVDWIRLHPVVTVWVLLIFGWLLTAMAGTMVRLSARKKAQKTAQEKAEEMAELAEHAQAANKAKTAFLSHMSHEDVGISDNFFGKFGMFNVFDLMLFAV